MTETTASALGIVESASRDAAEAASLARVTVVTVSRFGDLGQIVALFDQIWSTAGPPVIGLEHLRALAHAGNYVAAAYDIDRTEMLGATVGFFGAPAGKVLHSDVTGVDQKARDRKLGFALKLHQRAWALERGLDQITWTFDPLIARNAYFNLCKLRADAVRYYVDFYGDMGDGINAGQGSDRLLASWSLDAPDVVEACGRRHSAVEPEWGNASPLLTFDVSEPNMHAQVLADERVWVAVPPDIESLRHADPGLARRWRSAVRETLGTELSRGARVLGFDPTSGYLIQRAGHDVDRGGA